MAGGSTLPKRALGRELRRLRERSGTNQAAAARAIEVSPQTIGRLEDGHASRPTTLQINGLCDRYGASDEERRFVLDLVQELRAMKLSGGGWWRAYDDEIPRDFNHYLGLEAAACHMTSWQITLLPGLLQTPEYRRAIIWAAHPDWPTADVERRLELARHRREKLRDRTFRLDVLLSEAVLRHHVGGPGVMADQLLHLVEASAWPNVSVRVVPYDARSTIGLVVRSFVFLEFPVPSNTRIAEPPVAYVEGYTGDLYLERAGEVAQYTEAIRRIAKVALNEQETSELVARIAKEYQR
ncbi:helix-turn-helix domain-containing protein [Nocardia flavorosea]|uniref:helix-turn-helix domain-containing protein n=1 Tax=Nocardia flavorosea TaxID=53429 RepID=UPI002458D68A|nr:helix-turn-helix transcriptional regulator [Nocardia flavorosea]